MRVLACLGGTFDPVHNGHLHIASGVSAMLTVDECRFIPCNVPPLKEQPIASADDRLAMLTLACEPYEKFTVDDRELQRDGKSYTMDTLLALRTEMPGDSINWILGIDAFVDFPKWHRWTELLDVANFIVVNRADYHPEITAELAEIVDRHHVVNIKECRHRTHGAIAMVMLPEIAISSTEIRQQFNDAADSLPYDVYQYALNHGLYGH